MSVRFVIMRDVQDEEHRWSLRDGLCRNCERHNFNNPYWAEGCYGECDTFKSFRPAIAKASGAI